MIASVINACDRNNGGQTCSLESRQINEIVFIRE